MSQKKNEGILLPTEIRVVGSYTDRLLISKTTTLHVHHAFFYISLSFLHDYDMKMSNFAFYGGRKQATTKVFFSF